MSLLTEAADGKFKVVMVSKDKVLKTFFQSLADEIEPVQSCPYRTSLEEAAIGTLSSGKTTGLDQFGADS